jgi:type I restriction enzyme M protein
MGSQGDAGQFRTPRHIIDFIVDVVEPSKTDKVLDPACGTAGFLISAYNHIKKNGLTSEEMTQLSENFVGYDISQDMQRLSLVNLYLHHFPNPHIYEYDTLTSEDRWNDDFDVILANPPFMTPKGGIRPHNRFSVPSKRAEVLFVDYIMEHLTARGKAGVIVPEGIIFQSQGAYAQLRKMMVEENYLWAVVSLPGGIFNPYSGVKTSILLFDREIAKKTNKILFVKVNSDGFDLGAQRRESDKNDLPVARKLLLKFKEAILSGKELSLDTVLEMGGGSSDKDMMSSYGFDLNANSHIELEQIISKAYDEVSKINIKDSGYNLSGDRYKKANVLSTAKWPMVKLEEILSLDFGERITKSERRGTKYPVYGGGGESFRTDQFNRENDFVIARFAMSENCVRYVTGQFWLMDSGGTFSIKKNYQNRITKEYVGKILLAIQKYIFRCARGGAQKNLNQEQFYELEIPVPPISVQNETVEELDRYQKIIDGARQVVENYQPEFQIDDGWEWKKLSELCELISDGTHQTPTYSETGTIFLSSKNVTKRKIDWDNVKHIPESLHLELQKRISPKLNDILLAKNGTTGVAAIVDRDIVFDIYVSLAVLRPSNKVLPPYLLHLVNSPLAKKQFNSRLHGVGVPNLHLREIKEVKIPVPSLEIQKDIVSRIEEEMRIVDENVKFMELYKKKISAKINEIWKQNV